MNNNTIQKISLFALLSFLLFSIAISQLSVVQSDSVWTLTEVVSTESTLNSDYPAIATSYDGDVYIVWSDVTDYNGAGDDIDIFFKSWNSQTESWTSTEVLSDVCSNDSVRPVIAVDNSGNVHVSWTDMTEYSGCGNDSDIFYRKWTKVSSSWSAIEVVSSESTEGSSMSAMVTDTKGNVHIVWGDITNLNGAGDDKDIFYKFWNSTTSVWNTTEVVSTNSTEYSGHNSLDVSDSSNVYICWIDETDYYGAGDDMDVFYTFWNSTSSSWKTTEVVSDPSDGFSLYTALGVDSNDNIFISWIEYTSKYIIACRVWNNTMYEWEDMVVVSSESTSASSMDPTLAVDKFNNVHIAWQDNSNILGAGGGDYDIFYKYLDATTDIWTTTQVVSTESTDGAYSAWLDVDGEGSVHVTWWDLTNYDSCGTDYDVFYKKLIDVLPVEEFSIVPIAISISLLICTLVLVVKRKKRTV